jgi:hypothetical protein
MSLLARLFLVLLLTSVMANAQWRQTREIRLVKDQTEQIMVNSEGMQKLLTFRWTLYTNERLVLFRTYDGIPTQHILRPNHHNQSIRTELEAVMPKSMRMPYVLIKFKSFDHEKNEAVFELLLQDKEELYTLKFLRDKEEENE